MVSSSLGGRPTFIVGSPSAPFSTPLKSRGSRLIGIVLHSAPYREISLLLVQEEIGAKSLAAQLQGFGDSPNFRCGGSR
jgi:hypothetical protein